MSSLLLYQYTRVFSLVCLDWTCQNFDVSTNIFQFYFFFIKQANRLFLENVCCVNLRWEGSDELCEYWRRRGIPWGCQPDPHLLSEWRQRVHHGLLCRHHQSHASQCVQSRVFQSSRSREYHTLPSLRKPRLSVYPITCISIQQVTWVSYYAVTR